MHQVQRHRLLLLLSKLIFPMLYFILSDDLFGNENETTNSKLYFVEIESHLGVSLFLYS